MKQKTAFLMLAFFAKYHESPHTFSKDARIIKTVKYLEKHGFLYVNWNFHQASFTGKTFAEKSN